MVWLGFVLWALMAPAPFANVRETPAFAPGPPQSAEAQQQQQQQPQQSPAVRTPARPGEQQNQPAPAATTGSHDVAALDDVVSIDRIRKALEQPPKLTFVMPDPNVPRYRVEVQGGAFKPTNFLNSFYIPPTPTPLPLGGMAYYDQQRLNTPPEFWGSAPFTNKDLLGMAALNGAYSLVGALIKKGMEAHASAEDARVHQEVEEELRELAEHNARVGAGQADEGSEKKPPAKKPGKKAKKDGKAEVRSR